ncbi:MAG: carboxymuconolactone decarboxylase family protein [Gammaproteobacteria bacterium]|nr:carboxymuconolactone decarboxylase family protein [Gammaproteobacteria bacterium]
MSRIKFPSPETMTDEQLAVYNVVVAGPRGRMVGPLRAAIHNPELAAPWQQLGSVLRYRTSLPPELNELAILVTARRWNSEVEWSIHKGEALKAGLDAVVVEAIGQGNSPAFADVDSLNIYEFCRQLLLFGDTDDEVYQQILNRWMEVGVVELSALVGYYSMVAMTLNVHKIPFPEGTENELPQAPKNQLFEIPPAKELPSVSGTTAIR